MPPKKKPAKDKPQIKTIPDEQTDSTLEDPDDDEDKGEFKCWDKIVEFYMARPYF